MAWTLLVKTGRWASSLRKVSGRHREARAATEASRAKANLAASRTCRLALLRIRARGFAPAAQALPRPTYTAPAHNGAQEGAPMSDDKTEQPTEKRLRKAREDGEVAKST